jgi:hypothetical protein
MQFEKCRCHEVSESDNLTTYVEQVPTPTFEGSCLLTFFGFTPFLAPYLHVAYTIGGMWFANVYLKFEQGLVEDINAIRANKGMPPLVGSNAWIRYDTSVQ